MDAEKLIPEALAEVCAFLKVQGWEYCLVGGLAAARWGESRATNDIDLVLMTGFGRETEFIKPLLKSFSARYADAAKFAKIHRMVLVESKSGVGIDISLGGLPFEEQMLSRAQPTEIVPGLKIVTATPEDIVVMKSIAGRPIDVKDIEGIIAAQGKRLDCDYIRYWLADLAELWIETDVIGVFELAWKTVTERMKATPRSMRARKKRGK